MAKLGSVSVFRGLCLLFGALALLSWAPIAAALTSPISGAVAYPSTGPKLYLPFPAGYKIKILSGYSPSGGSSLHADTNATSKANDYYALDLVFDGQPNFGKGLPVVAPLPGKVVRAGWATSGWANYGQRVILEHDLGDGHKYHSLYAHLDSVSVAEGASVSVGQKLGTLGQSCMGTLSCSSFSTPHLHWALHRNSLVGGSGTGGSYGGNAVVPEPMDGTENLKQGMIITSTNSDNPVCGDSVCNGTETPATCPGDCKLCELIPSQGRIVDESETLCFKQSGSPQYWYPASAGYGNSLYYTHATSDPNPDNYSVWELDFAEAGNYSVEVYTAKSHAQSKQAKYTVKHGGQSSQKTVDQSAQDGWQPLGTYAFAKGATQSVRLDDNTGEALSLKRQLVFDAIRLTRITGSGGSGGASSGGAAGTAGLAGAAGGVAAGGGQSAGGTSATGGSPSSGGGPGVGAGGSMTSEDEAGGCACRAAREGGRASLGALAALLFSCAAVGRRRRRER
ncbi:MAG: peptidoglycan DD-metalloendopeptidase family protein [Polyangiaceae bacterium]|nr:peptidoglycan DD-metalloendopeptidase family protein [Polyangiaceae bacterium]MCL4751448.1 peptidoglycan DD-metalloendopeptidase family protein [Myxococcales bacterium]